MIFRHERKGCVWVDVEQPTMDELRQVADEFSISERLEAELFSPTPLPLLAHDERVALLVLHFPAEPEHDGDTKLQEVDFIVGPHFVITVRYEVVAPLHRLRKLFEADDALGHDRLEPDALLEILFAHLYAAARDHATLTAARLSRVERQMFSGQERETVRAISTVSREFLHLEASIVNQREPLARFFGAIAERGFYGHGFPERAKRIEAEREQAAHLAATYRAVAVELRETNASLIEASQNQIMRALTTITVIVLPLELIAFVFGMHALGTPLENNPHAFWIIMAGMLATVGLMIAVFAKKRWIL